MRKIRKAMVAVGAAGVLTVGAISAIPALAGGGNGSADQDAPARYGQMTDTTWPTHRSPMLSHDGSEVDLPDRDCTGVQQRDRDQLRLQMMDRDCVGAQVRDRDGAGRGPGSGDCPFAPETD